MAIKSNSVVQAAQPRVYATNRIYSRSCTEYAKNETSTESIKSIVIKSRWHAKSLFVARDKHRSDRAHRRENSLRRVARTAVSFGIWGEDRGYPSFHRPSLPAVPPFSHLCMSRTISLNSIKPRGRRFFPSFSRRPGPLRSS